VDLPDRRSGELLLPYQCPLEAVDVANGEFAYCDLPKRRYQSEARLAGIALPCRHGERLALEIEPLFDQLCDRRVVAACAPLPWLSSVTSAPNEPSASLRVPDTVRLTYRYVPLTGSRPVQPEAPSVGRCVAAKTRPRSAT